ncbi:MAG TPA: hypothetical protein VGO53_16415 [Steroidobacteraceae bacterium]|jgi:hypothetical protein|nr:hypothetical protein [Steroidobacteraceae bacterium]
MSEQLKIPGGNDKGMTLDAAQTSSLTYWNDRISKTLDAGESRYPDRDKKLVAGLRAEIARRQAGGAQAAPKASSALPAAAPAGGNSGSAIVTRQPDDLQGTYSKPDEIGAIMATASQVGHLITPQTSCGQLPAGCALAVSCVYIDVDRETYGIPHPDSAERGLDKTALAKISAAAGIDWDAAQCSRLDNGRDPHYVHYRAVGYVRNFDGTLRTEIGSVEMDLRDGSEAMLASKDKELPMTRKFILRHAESKAMNRVIRRLGVRSKYSRADLQKPFVIVKIMFTGVTDDPALKMMFAGKTADAFLGSRQALYGGGQPRHMTPGPTHHQLPPHDPPPIGTAAEDDWSDYDKETGEVNTPAATSAPAQLVDGASVPGNALNVSAASKPVGQQQELTTNPSEKY